MQSVFFYFGRTTQHHVRGSVLILSDGNAHKICGPRQHTHMIHKTLNRTASKLNTSPCCMQDHINCETQKTSAPSLDQHLYTLARNHAHTRNGNIPGDVDAMGQHCLENHDALFWINPFVMSRSPTHQRHNVSEISDTREDTTTTTTKTHFEGTTCNIGHDAVSWYLLPLSVPNQKQLKPERISLSKETTRTTQNNPNTPNKSTNQIEITDAINKSSPQHHHLQLTFTRHKNKRL